MTLTQDPNHPTGVSDDSPRGNKEVARARNRKANAALQLRKAGADWEEIAQVLGFPTGNHAQVATERALEKELAEPESREFMRHLAGARLDRLLRSVYPRAINEEHPEHLSYVDRARKLVEDYRKLHGLDAPTELVVSNPTQTELENWVASVVEKTSPSLEEADIFDAEVVEDEDAVPSG